MPVFAVNLGQWVEFIQSPTPPKPVVSKLLVTTKFYDWQKRRRTLKQITYEGGTSIGICTKAAYTRLKLPKLTSPGIVQLSPQQLQYVARYKYNE